MQKVWAVPLGTLLSFPTASTVRVRGLEPRPWGWGLQEEADPRGPAFILIPLEQGDSRAGQAALPAPCDPCDSPPPHLRAEAFSWTPGRMGAVFRQLSPPPRSCSQRAWAKGVKGHLEDCSLSGAALHQTLPSRWHFPPAHIAWAPCLWSRPAFPGQEPCPLKSQESITHPPGSFSAQQPQT